MSETTTTTMQTVHPTMQPAEDYIVVEYYITNKGRAVYRDEEAQVIRQYIHDNPCETLEDAISELVHTGKIGGYPEELTGCFEDNKYLYRLAEDSTGEIDEIEAQRETR